MLLSLHKKRFLYPMYRHVHIMDVPYCNWSVRERDGGIEEKWAIKRQNLHECSRTLDKTKQMDFRFNLNKCFTWNKRHKIYTHTRAHYCTIHSYSRLTDWLNEKFHIQARMMKMVDSNHRITESPNKKELSQNICIFSKLHSEGENYNL